VSASYIFGCVEVRPAQRQLVIAGELAAVGARAFDLLMALIQHRDRVVAKSELLDLVWPGLVVEENNLQVQVSTLRKLLGAQAIATIPGRGYRFTMADDVANATSSFTARPAASEAQHLSERRAEPTTIQRNSVLVAPQLLGRDADASALLQLLEQQALVTVVGAGGIGKTSLAAVAATTQRGKWRDGVIWVELASLNDARLLAGAVAQAAQLQLAEGGDSVDALVSALKPLQLLLVLDNAEHLIDGVANLVYALQRGAPEIRFLVTSQMPLRLQAEQVMRLEALTVPQGTCTVEQASHYGAVTMFVERVRAADRHFALDDNNVAAIVDICRRLDGMPLALELAAARVSLLGINGVAQRLDDRFKLLASGNRSSPTRQQTLQAALRWSESLLAAPERTLFRQLGVFAGGFTLELVCAVIPGEQQDDWAVIDALATLVDHSLVSVTASASPRYGLSETARAYAQLELGSNDDAHQTLRARHAAAMMEFFAAAPIDWLHMSDDVWLARYEPELDNLRAALNFAYQTRAITTLVSLVGSAAPLWHHLSLHAEARRWHELSEPLVAGDVSKSLAAQWWRAAQWVWADNAPERSRAAAERAHALYRELNDVHGLYAQLTGLAGMWNQPNQQASAALHEALALEQPEWPARERAWGQRAVADVARAEGRLKDSRAAREAELSLRLAAGDRRGQLRAMTHLIDVEMLLDELVSAEQRSRSLIALLRLQRSPRALHAALVQLMAALRLQGKHQEAEAVGVEVAALASSADAQPQR